MAFRKIIADQLFDGKKLWRDRALILQPDGTVEAIVPKAEAGPDADEVNGILMPGFINCHCHLELSHMKDVIPPHTGLVPFLISVVKKRGVVHADKEAAITSAEKELYRSGVAAVADICNTTDTIIAKCNSSIRWYNLVEVINFYDGNLQKQITACQQVQQAFEQQQLSAILTPHAPYSISAATFAELNRRTAGGIISIHNQETAAENELFQKGSGDFIQLYTEFGDGRSPFPVSGKSSLQTWLPYFTHGQTILLVHNTFITEEDILFAQEHAEKHRLTLVYCLCPNANLYIENRLPPVELLLKHHCFIVLGTDSYSSNTQLNIAAELKTLSDIPSLAEMKYPVLEMLLQWATINGAKAFGWSDLGCFKKGLKPGVVVMNETDFSARRIL